LVRKIAISLSATLAVAAMLWGNCLSCPEMMLAAASHQPAHSCCHKPQPTASGCHMQGMQHFVKADAPAPHAPAAAEPADFPATIALAPRQLAAPLPDWHAPPGSPGVSAALRI
jgi:hypothetical protein